jgi:hypothetical protein
VQAAKAEGIDVRHDAAYNAGSLKSRQRFDRLLAGMPDPVPTDAVPPPGIPIPDTLAGRTFGEFLRAYNTGDPDALRRFFLSHVPDPGCEERQQSARRRADWVAGIYQGYRAVDPRQVERATEDEIVVLCQSRITEACCTFEMEVDAEPWRGVAIGFTYATRPAAAVTQRRLSPTEITDRLTTYLEKLVAADLFSGVVLVAKDGRPIFKAAHGWADRLAQRPNRIDTPFSLASMSKMFTGVAITQQRKICSSSIARYGSISC